MRVSGIDVEHHCLPRAKSLGLAGFLCFGLVGWIRYERLLVWDDRAMIGQVEGYLAARAEFIAATKELEAIGAFIREVGESLTDMLSIPTDAAAKWKSLEELKALLDRRKSLAYKMMDFWEEIPKQIQEGLQPPPPHWPETSPRFKQGLLR